MQLSMRSGISPLHYFSIYLSLHCIYLHLLIVSCDHNYHYYLDFAMNHCIICKPDDKKNDYDNLYKQCTVVLIDVYISLYHRSVLYENLLNTSPDIDPLDRCCAVAALRIDYQRGNKEMRKGNIKKKMHLELKFCSQAQAQAQAQDSGPDLDCHASCLHKPSRFYAIAY